MNHTELQSAVVKLFGYTGWSHLHVRKSIGKGKRWVTTTNVIGWPDLAPIWSPRQPGRHLAIEIKIPPDMQTDEQVECFAALTAAGFECYVVTPADLEDLPAILSPRRRPR